MAQCRLTDPTAGPADSRMAAYFDRQHHPQMAMLPRVGYVALAGPFYATLGASELNRHWYIWEDIGAVLTAEIPHED